MNDQYRPADDADVFPEAESRRSRWFGLVWAIPLAALILVGYLGIEGIMNRGVKVTVTFGDVTGAKVGDTKVMYQGIEAGHVSAININDDHKHVDLTLTLDPRVEPILNSNTKFWLVGENPDLGDISSVKAALAGLTIGIGPGTGGTQTRHFVGLNQPPAVMPGTPGTPYVLTCAVLGNVKTGSSLFYRGQEVGKVTAVNLTETDIFRIDFFVYAPFDRYIRPGTAFWVSSPLHVGFDENGVSANVQHPGAILDGGIEIDRDDDAADATVSPPGTVFQLYEYGGVAKAASAGPQVIYAMTFSGAAGTMSAGAPVRLLGFRVGAVKSVDLSFDKVSGAPRTSVTVVLYPKRLQVIEPKDAKDTGAWVDVTNATMARLLAQGYRAQLSQDPPVVGSMMVTLVQVKGAAPGHLGAGKPLSIPTTEQSGGLDELTGQMSQILAKVNAIPIEAIGKNVHDITSKIDQLVSSPEVSDSLKHLDSTLAQADQIMAEAKPQIGPLITKLNQAADDVAGTASAARSVLSGDGGKQDANLPAAIEQLTDAARSIRALADYLGRHPEALIKGKGNNQ